jgi:hypothetical protein
MCKKWGIERQGQQQKYNTSFDRDIWGESHIKPGSNDINR